MTFDELRSLNTRGPPPLESLNALFLGSVKLPVALVEDNVANETLVTFQDRLDASWKGLGSKACAKVLPCSAAFVKEYARGCVYMHKCVIMHTAGSFFSRFTASVCLLVAALVLMLWFRKSESVRHLAW